jgi:hypothetical protein
MKIKKKAARAGTRTASSKRSTKNHSTLSRIKAAIVRLALWGVLPVSVAEWIIQRGGLRHV